MIQPEVLFKCLKQNQVDFFCGVPDSLLKDFCAYLMDNTDQHNHLITANEGNAIALATGYYLASGNPALVYMQNSGLGNAMNPLLSLADSEVYGIPMLLMIGWRGEPGVHDEPQHVKQGRIQIALLDTMEMPYEIISEQTDEIEPIIKRLLEISIKQNKPVALVVRKGTFESYKQKTINPSCQAEMMREEALSIILDNIQDGVIVSTTGKTSRELFELRVQKQLPQTDFLTVGSMGHASSIALGIALEKPDRKIFCLDGDGALIMHMGALPIIGQAAPSNFVHVLLNNYCHESVGGQPTVAGQIDFEKLSSACGYPHFHQVNQPSDLTSLMQRLPGFTGPIFIEVKVKKGSRADLGRPTSTTEQNKNNFMKYLQK